MRELILKLNKTEFFLARKCLVTKDPDKALHFMTRREAEDFLKKFDLTNEDVEFVNA